jgi:hypothetical protein
MVRWLFGDYSLRIELRETIEGSVATQTSEDGKRQ